MTAKQLIRFWSRVDKQSSPIGCWLWTHQKNHKGYGQAEFSQKCYSAHRLSFMLLRGEIPDGLCVLHKCDVRACVNPDHLWLGTNAENTADRDAKGRHRALRGELHHNSKLTAEQVKAILLAPGKQRDIAKQFGITQANVSIIRRREGWAHVEVS